MVPPTLARASHEGPDRWCGSGPETEERIRELRLWMERRLRRERVDIAVPRLVEPDVRLDGGVVLVRADPTLTLFDHPIDLIGRSVGFSRAEGGYTASLSDLEYEDPGPLFHVFGRGPRNGAQWFVVPYTVRGFKFPWGTEEVERLYLSAYRAVSPEPPPDPGTGQIGVLELAGLAGRLISPLLHNTRGHATPYLYLREASDRLVLTWRSRPEEGESTLFDLDVQVVLFANGDLRFSYRKADNVDWGGVVLHAGNEAWWAERRVLGQALGPLGDSAAPGPWKDLLDLERLEVERIGGSDLLEIRITVGAPFSPDTLPTAEGRGANFTVELSDGENRDRLFLSVSRNGWDYGVPGWGRRSNSPAVSFEDRTIALRFLQDLLTIETGPVLVRVTARAPGVAQPADTLAATIELEEPAVPLAAGLGGLEEPRFFASPVLEGYTLPEINLAEIWRRVGAALDLRSEEVDGLAVYQNFFTEILFRGFAAFAGGGNHGADGVGMGGSRAVPRRPTLMHMNRVGFGANRVESSALSLLHHEFGHRWLYGFQILDPETGMKGNILNPVSAHPAQYVHTPAPFSVWDPGESSAMGGGRFAELDVGRFRVAGPVRNRSFTWHELYLMGLAAPHEVEPWFYVADSNPPLGGEYYPSPAWSGSGVRKEVTIANLIDAMGPRVPSHEADRRDFKVLFAILEREGQPTPVEEVARIVRYRLLFEETFARAIGHRARISTGLSPRSLYFPFYRSSDEFFTAFAVVNRGGGLAALRWRLLGRDADPATLDESPVGVLREGEQWARLGNEIFGAPDGSGSWVELVVDGGEVGGFFQFGGFDLRSLDGAVAQRVPATRLDFTRVFEGTGVLRGREARTLLSLANPNPGPVKLRLKVLPPGDAAGDAAAAGPDDARETVIVLSAGGGLGASLAELFPGLPAVSDGRLEVEVLEGGGILGFQLIEVEGGSTLIGLNPWTESETSHLYSAQLAAGPGVFTSVKLVNTGGERREVALEAIGGDGDALAPEVSLSLGPGGSWRGDLDDLFEWLDPAAESRTGSLRVVADGPGVIGDVIFGDPRDLAFAAALSLQSRPFREAVFGHVGLTGEFFTGLALFNPGDEDADVLLKVLTAAGDQVGEAAIPLEGGRRQARLLSEWIAGLPNLTSGYVVLESSRPLIAQQLFGTFDLSALSAVPPSLAR